MVVFAEPNDEFSECCKEKSVPDACLKYCTYDTPSALKFFHFKPKSSLDDECTTPEVLSSLVQCVQKGKDNRECCKESGVGNDFDYCLDLCDGTKPLSSDEKYVNCHTEDNAKKIKECGKNS
uniref:Uncharacterized protein n=1 Tax=Panagrolaimus sp. ES5 TaxID=591445 RepID=A0AC34FIP1_9BILA